MFDSVNARELLPVEQYLMGSVLPPHLSPFTDTLRDQTYIPPEQRALLDPEFKVKTGKVDADSELVGYYLQSSSYYYQRFLQLKMIRKNQRKKITKRRKRKNSNPLPKAKQTKLPTTKNRRTKSKPLKLK